MNVEREIDDKLVTSGAELLEPNKLYTHGRLAFTCVRHERGSLPRLKLKLFAAWFVEAMSTLTPFTPPEELG